MQESPSDHYSRVFDQNSNSYYYWNLTTYEVTWTEPPGWNAAEAAQRERAAAGLSLKEAGGLGLLIATRKIQAVFRSRQIRKMLHAWTHVFDPNENKHYYWNTITYEVTWEIPPGYNRAEAEKRERDAAAGLSLESQGGLGLLIATRKIQAVYRKKKAREKSREYNAARAAEGAPPGGVWIRMDDPTSGYPYWYHRDTHECVWKNPYPKALGDRFKDTDGTIFHPERVVFVLIHEYLGNFRLRVGDATNKRDTFEIVVEPERSQESNSLLSVVSKHLNVAIKLSKTIQHKWIQKKKIKFGPLLSCGSLMAMRIRGKEECAAIADVMNALRFCDGADHPTAHLQNKIERFKLDEKLLLYRGNRRWLQKHRVGMLGNMSDIVWLSAALGRIDAIAKCLENPMHTLGELRDINEDAAALHEFIHCIIESLDKKVIVVNEREEMEVNDLVAEDPAAEVETVVGEGIDNLVASAEETPEVKIENTEI